MLQQIRLTLAKGDKVIVKRNMNPYGNRNIDLYGRIGTIIETKNMPPKYPHSMFDVDFGNGIIGSCCGYNCDKVVIDKNGFVKLER